MGREGSRAREASLLACLLTAGTLFFGGFCLFRCSGGAVVVLVPCVALAGVMSGTFSLPSAHMHSVAHWRETGSVTLTGRGAGRFFSFVLFGSHRRVDRDRGRIYTFSPCPLDGLSADGRFGTVTANETKGLYRFDVLLLRDKDTLVRCQA